MTALLYKQRIEKASNVCLTPDIWTETMAEKSYLGIPIHFLERVKIVNCNMLQENLTIIIQLIILLIP